jgi:hypothetical protein
MVFFLNGRCCHRPQKRTIQYTETVAIKTNGAAYWMPRFRGA